MKAVQDNAVKNNPGKKIYCDSSRGSTRDDSSASGRTVAPNYSSGSYNYYKSPPRLGRSSPAGRLVVTVQIAVWVDLVSVVAN